VSGILIARCPPPKPAVTSLTSTSRPAVYGFPMGTDRRALANCRVAVTRVTGRNAAFGTEGFAAALPLTRYFGQSGRISKHIVTRADVKRQAPNCRGRDDHHWSPPAQIRTCAFTHTASMRGPFLSTKILERGPQGIAQGGLPSCGGSRRLCGVGGTLPPRLSLWETGKGSKGSLLAAAGSDFYSKPFL
jgi:hypothetical protein